MVVVEHPSVYELPQMNYLILAVRSNVRELGSGFHLKTGSLAVGVPLYQYK